MMPHSLSGGKDKIVLYGVLFSIFPSGRGGRGWAEFLPWSARVGPGREQEEKRRRRKVSRKGGEAGVPEMVRKC
jgi:hypothetical protein